jgi:hypothetical protein
MISDGDGKKVAVVHEWLWWCLGMMPVKDWIERMEDWIAESDNGVKGYATAFLKTTLNKGLSKAMHDNNTDLDML